MYQGDESVSDGSTNDSTFHSSDDSEGEEEEHEPQCMYGNEPEYSREEMRLLESQAVSDGDDNSDDEHDDAESSRLENLHWCACEKLHNYAHNI